MPAVQLYAAGIGIRYRGVPPAANRIQPYSTKFKYGAAPRRRRRAIYFKTNISAEHSNQRLKNACVLGNAFCAYTVSEIRGDPSRNMKIGMAP